MDGAGGPQQGAAGAAGANVRDEVWAKVLAGEWYDGTGIEPSPVLDAKDVRLFLMSAANPAELAAQASARVSTVQARGLRVKGVEILGAIDLEDCRGPDGGTLGALMLEACLIKAPINLRNARLARLSLRGSKIVELDGRNLYVDGPVDISELRSAEEEGKETGIAHHDDWHGGRAFLSGETPKLRNGAPNQGRCWVRLKNASITGELLAANAILVAPKLPEKEQIDGLNKAANFALECGGIRCTDVIASPVFAALGGMSLSGARLGGNFFAAGARLIAGEREALSLQLAAIDGFIALRVMNHDGAIWRFEAVGEVSIMNSDIRGGIDLRGAWLIEGDKTPALNAHAATLGGFIIHAENSVPFESSGQIVLSDARIRGECHLQGAVLRAGSDGAPVLNAHGINVGSDWHFGPELLGVSNLSFASIDGNLELSGLLLSASSWDNLILDLHSCKVRGALKTGQGHILVEDANPWQRLWSIAHRRSSSVADIRARMSALPWAPDWRLVHLSWARPNHSAGYGRGTTAFLWNGAKRAYPLNLDGGPINAFNREMNVRISSKEMAEQYLRFFCAHMWGDDGPFAIVEPSNAHSFDLGIHAANAVTPVSVEVVEKDGEKQFVARAYVLYARRLFDSYFTIPAQGSIIMNNDDPMPVQSSGRIRYEKPIATLGGGETFQLGYEPASGWSELDPELALEALKLLVRDMGVSNVSASKKPIISLAGARVGELEDLDGDAWPEAARLDLEGLTYENVPWAVRAQEQTTTRFRQTLSRWLRHPVRSLSTWLEGLSLEDNNRRRLASRLSWLKLQSKADQFDQSGNVGTRHTFYPQPYEQLIDVLNRQGEYEIARRINIAKLQRTAESSMQWMRRRGGIWWHLYPLALIPSRAFRFFFGYGTSAKRAIATFMACFIAGWSAIMLADRYEILVKDGEEAVEKWAVTSQRTDPLCGDELSAGLYALDLFIPLVDLRQETRCRVRLDQPPHIDIAPWPRLDPERWPPRLAAMLNGMVSGGEAVWRLVSSPLRQPWFWRWGLALYGVLGWVVTSLTIVTLTGVMRRQSKQ